MNSLGTKKFGKLGIVLEGGGGKGAYALGCLKAFSERGIEFDVISGSSVGALNAAIYASEQLELGTKFWFNLKPSDVYRNRRLPLFRYTIQVLYLLSKGLLLVVAHRPDPKFMVKYLKILIMVNFILLFVISLSSILFSDIIGSFNKNLTLILPTFLFLLIILLMTASFLLRSINFSVFHTKPLQQSIKQIFNNVAIKIPTYVTVTRRSVVFDPDLPHLQPWTEYGPFTATEVEGHFPVYLRLDQIANSEIVKILTASAALPLGVFPEIDINGESYIDGGVSDNLPLFPLITYESCDEIVLIHLRPVKESTAALNEMYLNN
jgi:predicted acylesterase/phospholipase RssA